MKTNEPKHSPAPWHCNLGDGSNLTNDCTIWDASGNQVATVGDNTLPHCLPQDVPNGQLLAAAPGLLNMLQRMVDETSDGTSAPCPLTLEQARAALEKAKVQS